MLGNHKYIGDKNIDTNLTCNIVEVINASLAKITFFLTSIDLLHIL